MKNYFKSRKFRQGSASTALTVIVVAALVVLNMVATALSSRYSLSFDLTENQFFGISAETKAFLQGLDKDIDVYVLNTEQGFNGGGEYFTQASEVIKKYAQESPRVRVQYIDVVRNPTFTTRFPGLALGSNSIIVSCGDKATDLTPYDLYNIQSDPYTGGEQIISSKAEQSMTSAMLQVTSDEIVRVTVLSGHNEIALEGLRPILEVNNYEVVEQNLFTELPDPEAMLAVLAAPARDLTGEELTKLDDWLYNGGAMGKSLLYFAADTQPPEMPNLSAFLADWGIEVGGGVVFETSLNRVMNMNMFMTAVDYSENIYSETAQAQGLLTLIPYSRALAAPGVEGKTITTALSFSESAGIMPADATEDWQPTETDIAGPYPGMVVATETSYEGGGVSTSNVVVCGSVLAIDQSLLGSTSLGNGEYFLSLFNTLAEREDVVFIQPKTIGASELGIESTMQAIILGILLTVALPLAVLIGGLVFWFGRRHK